MLVRHWDKLNKAPVTIKGKRRFTVERSLIFFRSERVTVLRKFLIPAVILILAAFIIVASGCGPGAETILKKARSSEKKMETARFTLEQKMRLPRAPIREGKVEKQVFVHRATGEYDFRTGNFRIFVTLPTGANLAMLKIGEKQFWQLAGYWYESTGSVETSPPVTQALSFSQYIKTFKKINKLGDTRIDGEPVYHVRGVPNMKELVKLPGVNELLKDPTGKQVRSIDELEDMKVVFDFYVRKKDFLIKRSMTSIEAKVTNDLIELGYAEPGDKMYMDAVLTFSDFNKRFLFREPSKYSPLPQELIQQNNP